MREKIHALQVARSCGDGMLMDSQQKSSSYAELVSPFTFSFLRLNCKFC